MAVICLCLARERLRGWWGVETVEVAAVMKNRRACSTGDAVEAA